MLGHIVGVIDVAQVNHDIALHGRLDAVEVKRAELVSHADHDDGIP